MLDQPIRMPKRLKVAALAVAALLAASCATGRGSQLGQTGDIGESCVLYARSASTIDLRGDAYTWWDAAVGRYLRGQTPEPGAVLVLTKTDRLRRGHLAVVRQVIDLRTILVDHSNWVPGEIITGMQVMDASPANDWTEVRFLSPGQSIFGAVYPADGFIYPAAPSVPKVGLSGDAGPQVAAQ